MKNVQSVVHICLQDRMLFLLESSLTHSLSAVRYKNIFCKRLLYVGTTKGIAFNILVLYVSIYYFKYKYSMVAYSVQEYF